MPLAFRMSVLAAISATLIMLLLVLPAAAQDNSGEFAVADVRVGAHDDKTRLVLDLTGPAAFRYSLAANREAVFIELPGLRWYSPTFEPRHSKGLVTEFTHDADGNGVTLSVLTDGPVSVKPPFVLPPGGGKGHRVVFDMVRAPATPTTKTAASTPDDVPDYVEVASADPSFSQAPPRPRTQDVARHDARPNQGGEVAQRRPANPAAPGTVPLSGLYLRGAMGVNFLSTMDSSGSGNENSTEFDTGWELGGAAGIDLQNGLRAEAEMRFTTNDLQSVTGSAAGTNVNSTDVGGSLSSLAFMANLAYDFPNQSRFTPYIFGGLGLAGMFINDASVNGQQFADASDWVFAMQAGAGLSMDLDERTKLEAFYRYFESADPEFADSRNQPFEGEYTSHSFIAGVRISF